MPLEKYVFEVPFYRQSEKSLWEEYENNKAVYMNWAMARPGMVPTLPEIKERVELYYWQDSSESSCSGTRSRATSF